MDVALLVEQVRRAFEGRDLDAFGALLSDDVRWGDIDHPRACRNRSEVLATFNRILAEGADGRIVDIVARPQGILCELEVSWLTKELRGDKRQLFHVYLVRDSRIIEIQGYDDRGSAEVAAGLSKL
jgi:hypothetical protein